MVDDLHTETPKFFQVILCGGSGTRLWPLSRSGFPKQFLNFHNESSFFEQALGRIKGVRGASEKPIIVTGENHRFLALQQAMEAGYTSAEIILEPVGRNTAPAVTLAALAAFEQAKDPVLVVSPADHMISDTDCFHQAICLAVDEASNGSMVLLGVKPDRPDTGYGYISVKNCEGTEILDVESFVEKPSEKVASGYLEKGNYLWNGGFFVFKASVWLEALRAFAPNILESAQLAWTHSKTDGCFRRVEEERYTLVPSDSVDYAVIERCPGSRFSVRAVELDCRWSDMGTWGSVWQTLDKNCDNNVLLGDVITNDVSDSLVISNNKLVSLSGVEGLIVVDTEDALLILNKHRCDGLQTLMRTLNSHNRDETELHRKVLRPWGWYDTIELGERFKVKLIEVNPGASLSLQHHRFRSEHWVVLEGEALVVRGSEEQKLSRNQSTYIPAGELHRLTNIGVEPLKIVEVQTGDYLGEDDIVRVSDQYGRS